jgi:hypothetical protein
MTHRKHAAQQHATPPSLTIPGSSSDSVVEVRENPAPSAGEFIPLHTRQPLRTDDVFVLCLQRLCDSKDPGPYARTSERDTRLKMIANKLRIIMSKSPLSSSVNPLHNRTIRHLC